LCDHARVLTCRQPVDMPVIGVRFIFSGPKAYCRLLAQPTQGLQSQSTIKNNVAAFNIAFGHDNKWLDEPHSGH
jgi:hypothetical protein